MSNQDSALVWIKEQSPFPTKLRRLLEERHVTQEELAKHLGKTRQTVSYYTQGLTIPNIYTAHLIADFFEVSIGYLLSDIEIKRMYYDVEMVDLMKKSYNDEMVETLRKIAELTSEAQERIIGYVDALWHEKKYNMQWQMDEWKEDIANN